MNVNNDCEPGSALLYDNCKDLHQMASSSSSSMYALWNLFSLSLSSFALAQPLLDHVHNCLVIIKVPNGNDSHVLWPIPALVEG